MSDIRRITVSEFVTFEEAEWALQTSLMATIALRGDCAVKLLSPPECNEGKRTIDMDCSMQAGMDWTTIFVGMMTQMHGCIAVGCEELNERPLPKGRGIWAQRRRDDPDEESLCGG